MAGWILVASGGVGGLVTAVTVFAFNISELVATQRALKQAKELCDEGNKQLIELRKLIKTLRKLSDIVKLKDGLDDP